MGSWRTESCAGSWACRDAGPAATGIDPRLRGGYEIAELARRGYDVTGVDFNDGGGDE